MKNGLLLGIVFFVLMGIYSCKTKEPVAETSAQPPKEMQEQTKPNSSEIDTSKVLSPDRERVAGKENWLGSEIVDEAVYRLKSKLSTNNDTNVKLKTILTNSFLAIGGNLTTSYPAKEGKEMGKKIIINSKDQILDVLETDSQKTEFKNLFLH